MAGSAENLEALRERLGLNDPFLVRYFRWIGDMLKGDFGYSIANGADIKTLLLTRLPATMELAAVALVLSSIIGITIGILSAIWQNSIIDYVGRFFSVLGQAIPQFFFGICLIQIFSIKLGLLPFSGRMSLNASRLEHFILPALTMTIAMCSVLMRYSRNNMLGVLNSDYVKTARCKGIPEWKVYVKHAFRNAVRPVLVILCFRLPMLIGGSVVIESVFAWPGIGSVITSSVIAGDYPVVMVTTLLVAAAILTASFLVDVLTALLDPRVRLGE
jgi:peptide/nickel transport system permease protein